MGFELQYESSRQTLYHLPLQHARFAPASSTTTTRVGSKHTIICITPYPSHNESSLAIVSQDDETRLHSGDNHHKDHNPKDAFQDAGSGRIMLPHQSQSELDAFFHSTTSVPSSHSLRRRRSSSSTTLPLPYFPWAYPVPINGRNHGRLRKSSSLSTVAEVASQRSLILFDSVVPDAEGEVRAAGVGGVMSPKGDMDGDPTAFVSVYRHRRQTPSILSVSKGISTPKQDGKRTSLGLPDDSNRVNDQVEGREPMWDVSKEHSEVDWLDRRTVSAKKTQAGNVSRSLSSCEGALSVSRTTPTPATLLASSSPSTSKGRKLQKRRRAKDGGGLESEGARRSPEIEDTVCGSREMTTSHALTEEGLALETAQRGTEDAKKSDAAMAEGESEDKARVGLFRMLSKKLRSTTRRGRGRAGEAVKEMPNCSVAISQHDGEHSELEPLQRLQSVRGTMLSNTIQDSEEDISGLYRRSASVRRHLERQLTLDGPGPLDLDSESLEFDSAPTTSRTRRSLESKTWDSSTPPSLISCLSSNSTYGERPLSLGGCEGECSATTFSPTSNGGDGSLPFPCPPTCPSLQRRAIFTELAGEDMPLSSESQSRRRCRQLLLEIDDDYLFADTVRKLMTVDRETIDPESALLVTLDSSQNSPPNDPPLQGGDIMKAFFIVRELVQGERRFVKANKFGMQRVRWAIVGSSVPPVPRRSKSLNNPTQASTCTESNWSRHLNAAVPRVVSSSLPGEKECTYILRKPSWKASRPEPRPHSSHGNHSPLWDVSATAYSSSAHFTSYQHSERLLASHILELREAWLRHLCAIHGVSTTLLSLIEHDPSPSGLAKAFVSLESKLVGVYSAWAEVVGTLIMAGLGREVVGARQRSAGENGMLKKRRSLRTTVEKNGEHENEHRLQLGDVLMMPIQRISQYTLLFQNLHACIGVSTGALPEVAAALAAATRLMEVCDRKQQSLR